MKLIIKSLDGSKEVIDLNKDVSFNTTKGGQYIFSKGFANYALDFKNNQKSVELTFDIDGKSVKVELKNIVSLLQENIPGSENPTTVVINNNVNDKEIDTLVDNTDFDGSEIIDKLESLVSESNDLTLISDFQSLIEALDAAAAGPEGSRSNGSTFSSMFSSLTDSLNDIADSARGENLTESISSIPVETGDTQVIEAVAEELDTIASSAPIVVITEDINNDGIISLSELNG
ncbi:MAG: hypothetical protein RBR65_09135, partial [Aliarcobacter sp.]|nr:hypothetical protein [Aliarcobacter sp.]